MSELRNPSENDDFEWVNDWANAAAPAAGGKPKHEPVQTSASAFDLAERPAPQATIAVAPARAAADAQSPDAIVPQPTDIVATEPPATTQPDFADRVARASRKRGPDADQFVHPATRRFFAALRASTGQSEAPTAADAPALAHGPQHPLAAASPALTSAEPAPEATRSCETAPITERVATTANEPATVGSADASLAPDASQLERDIADIECARDALLEPAPFTITEPRKARRRFSALRHAESVPILVGSVVGATLLLVFGAAASLISLR